jgi:hypothetical protein
MSRDSPVGISTALDWTAGDRFLKEATDFSLLHTVSTGCGAHPAFSPMGTAGSFPESKAVEVWS